MVATPTDAHLRANQSAGFTLAELVVASTMMAIVMATVYTSFSTAIKSWRIGETNYQTYEDARSTLGLLTRELQGIPPGTKHLFGGKRDEITFFSITPPMNVDEGKGPRVLKVKYSLKSGNRRDGKTIRREEWVVDSPLPVETPRDEPPKHERIKLGRRQEFELAKGVMDFQIRYIWVPYRPREEQLEPNEPPVPLELQVVDGNPEGAGLPSGLEIRLVLLDEGAAFGETTFQTTVAFRGPTSGISQEMNDRWLGSRGGR
jgi:prepilin-type N-terminal cleavage/methylation domain-containing protein